MAGVSKPLTRWTADTKTAFLLALRQHGTVVKAAAAIGRQAGTCYGVRGRDPAFAAEWDRTIAEVQASHVAEHRAMLDRLPDQEGVGRERRDGWNAARRARFVALLARGETVAAACEAVGLSDTSAYAQRMRSPRFAADWDRALSERGVSALEAAYARAIEGWEEPVVFQGQVVAQKRRYSDAALRLLVQREDKRLERAETAAEAARARGTKLYADADETDKVLLAKLNVLESRLKTQARRDAVEFAERMTREGWAP